MLLYAVTLEGDAPRAMSVLVKPWGSFVVPNDDAASKRRFDDLFPGRKRVVAPRPHGFKRLRNTFYGFDRDGVIAMVREVLEMQVIEAEHALADAKAEAKRYDGWLANDPKLPNLPSQQEVGDAD